MTAFLALPLASGVALGPALLRRGRGMLPTERLGAAAGAAGVAMLGLLAGAALSLYVTHVAAALCAAGLAYALLAAYYTRGSSFRRWVMVLGAAGLTCLIAWVTGSGWERVAIAEDLGGLLAVCLAACVGCVLLISPFLGWMALGGLLRTRPQLRGSIAIGYCLAVGAGASWLSTQGTGDASAWWVWGALAAAVAALTIFSLAGIVWLCRYVPGGRSVFWARWALGLALAILVMDHLAYWEPWLQRNPVPRAQRLQQSLRAPRPPGLRMPPLVE